MRTWQKNETAAFENFVTRKDSDVQTALAEEDSSRSDCSEGSHTWHEDGNAAFARLIALSYLVAPPEDVESADGLADDDSELSQVPGVYMLDYTYTAASKLFSIVREVQDSDCITIRAADQSPKAQYREPLTSEDRPIDRSNIAAAPSAHLGAFETANLQD